MLEVINLTCVRGTRRLFKDLSFSANAGELIELRGPNGSGKTSLLRILCGLSSPAAGEVRWNGENIRKLGEEYFGLVSYMAHQDAVKDELSALENLRIASGVAGNTLKKIDAIEMLARIGLDGQQDLPARALSAGQRRRIGLAKLLTSRAKVWILDEVLTSLDDAATELAGKFITDHLKENGIAVVATHQDLNLSVERIQRIQLS